MAQASIQPVIPDRRSAGLVDRLATAVLLVVLTGVACWLYAPCPARWDDLDHDRNGHYLFAQELALDIQDGDAVGFLSHLEKAKVWPPLHGLAAAVVLAACGPRHELAVVPSLVGWVMTVFFGCLVARRLGGWRAGSIAAVLIAASPAHRMYATDVMLESLGAGLTMLALWTYLRAKECPDDAVRWRALALTLLALFFEKYNYGSLLCIALLAAEMPRAIDWRPSLRRQLFFPLNHVIVSMLAVAAAVAVRGPTTVAGVSLYPPRNLITAAYAVLFVRLCMERRHVATWSVASRQMLGWFVLPVAVSFLLPQRLAYFLWTVGPTNTRADLSHGLTGSAALYWHAFAGDYHAATWCALLVAVLACVGSARARAVAGGKALPLFVAICAVLTLLHPQQQPRFMHTWMPSVWVLAGVGLAGANNRMRVPGLFAAAACVVALAMIPVSRAAMSTLDITDAYLPALDGARHVAVVSSQPTEQLVRWSYIERYRRRGTIEQVWARFDRDASQAAQWRDDWLSRTEADAVVVLDFPPGSPWYRQYPGLWFSYDAFKTVVEGLPRRFRRVQRTQLRGCTVEVWQRDDSRRLR